MALTPDVLLINENYLRNYTWLNSSVDVTLLKPAILLAQDVHLQQILGTDLYKKVLSDVANNAVAEPIETLLNDYILKVVCWYTVYELAPHLYIKTDNGSLMIRTSSDTQAVSSADVESYKQQALEKAVFYGNRMIDYLCKHVGSFSQYTSNVENQLWANPKSNRSVVMEIGQATPHHSWKFNYMVGNKINNY